MGRVRRYKRIKAVDPFSRSGGVVDLDKGKSVNRAPSKKDVEALPASIKRMLEQKAALMGGGGAGGGAAGRPDKPKPTQFFSHVKPMPGESMGAFHRRVNAERSKQLANIRAGAKAAKHISDKRREYLHRKKEKRRQKGTGILEPGYAAADSDDDSEPEEEDSAAAAPAAAAGQKRPRADSDAGGDDDVGGKKQRGADGAPSSSSGALVAGAASSASSAAGGGSALRLAAGAGAGAVKKPKVDEFPTEHIAFGERAMEPPKITVAPRKSQKQKAREALRKAQRATVVAGQGVDASAAAIAAADAAQAALDAARAAELKRAQMERYRAQVQEAYAHLKAKRVEDGKATAGDGDAAKSQKKKKKAQHHLDGGVGGPML